MASRSGITWERLDDDGRKVEVNARFYAARWEFSIRRGRHDEWRPLAQPTAEDYDELIDAVERRVQRGQIRRDVLKALRQQAPSQD